VRILWAYLRPYRWLILLSLTLAGVAQLLSLVDPIIFLNLQARAFADALH
jgi:ATP-binding cassette, subfamily B, bacterial